MFVGSKLMPTTVTTKRVIIKCETEKNSKFEIGQSYQKFNFNLWTFCIAIKLLLGMFMHCDLRCGSSVGICQIKVDLYYFNEFIFLLLEYF